MCVVDMDLDVIRKLFQTFVTEFSLIFPHDLAKACRYQEILLTEPQLLSYAVRIIRVKNTRDRFDLRFLTHCSRIVAFVESVHVDRVVHRLGVPEIQAVQSFSVSSDNRNVKRDRSDFSVVDVFVLQLTVFPASVDPSSESDYD